MTYSFGKMKLIGHSWPLWLESMAVGVTALTGFSHNVATITDYPAAVDGVALPWHKDDEPEHDDPYVVSVSLGSSAFFDIKDPRGETTTLALHDGYDSRDQGHIELGTY